MLKRGRVNLKNILLIFMVLQPFFDSYILYSDEVINFFGFSPTTILRFLLVGLIFVYLFINKFKSKENKYIFIYGLIVLIYTVLHHVVCINIGENVLYGTFKYNLINELFYLLRLVYPIIIAYIVYLMKLTKKEFKFVIQGTAVLVSLILIILNLTLLSQTSYFSRIITGNFFDWINPEISRYYLAGKGWFNSANQIGGLILVLLPINFHYAMNSKTKRDVLIFILLLLSSYSLGTRISCIGVSLVLIVMFLIFYGFKFFERKKVLKNELWNTLVIIIISLFIFNYAPIVNLSGSNLASLFKINDVINDNSEEQIVNLPSDLLENINEDKDICEFLQDTSTNAEYYQELYPCRDNYEFWANYVYGDYGSTDNRLIEKLITEEVYNKVENLQVKLFGMSRSRFESAHIYLERDIIVHYYTLGILGVIIFILPYFVICIGVGLNKLIKKRISYADFCLIVAIMLPLVVSILTGHIVDELIVTTYIGFCLGYLLFINKNKCNNIKRESDDRRKRVLFVVDENRMGGVSILLEDMLKYLDRTKYKLSILVLHDVDIYFKELDDDIEVIYGTKFFNIIDYNLKDLVESKKILMVLKKVYLVMLMKTGLIKYKIISERKKILDEEYDIEIAFKDGFTAIFTAYGNSKKKIHWLHYEYKKYNANGNYPKLFNNILPTFDKIVAVSLTVMNDFNDIYHLNDKTMVIENLIDTNKIIEKSKERLDRKLDNNKLNIVCIGRLHSCKGYDRLINIISKLSKKELELLNVEIYGDGLERKKLEVLIKEKKLNNIVHLKGKVNNPYMYLKGNDLFVLSSYFETFGLVIVEAMTLGVPVLAVRNANTDKLINNKINGYIVENNDDALFDGLRYLINNREILNKYKHNLVNYKYDNQKIIDSIHELLD